MSRTIPGEGTLFLNYRDWQTAVIDEFKDQHEEQNCFGCDGSGEVVCYHCSQDMDCDDCNGKGNVWVDSEGYEVPLPSTGVLAYKKHVIRTLLQISKLTGRSYWKVCKGFLDKLERGAL